MWRVWAAWPTLFRVRNSLGSSRRITPRRRTPRSSEAMIRKVSTKNGLQAVVARLQM